MHVVDNAKLKLTSYKFLPTYYSLFFLDIFHLLKISQTFASQFFSTKYSLLGILPFFSNQYKCYFFRRIFLVLLILNSYHNLLQSTL